VDLGIESFPHAHFIYRALISTRKRAHRVRHHVKPSTTLPVELQKTFENSVNQVLNLEHIPMKPLTFYAPQKVSMQSSRSCIEC
jgi:hypothetical protein